MSSERQSYADVVRTSVRVEYADDVINMVPSGESSSRPDLRGNTATTAPGYCNMSGYFALDWRSYKTPMIVSGKLRVN